MDMPAQDVTLEAVTLEDLAQIPGTCANYHLRRADRVITQLYDETLRPSGLKATQFTLLTAVRLKAPVAINCLAGALLMDRTTLTRNLRPLQKEGWIVIAPGQDRRVREVSLTAEGRQVLDRAYPLWQQAQTHIAERLGVERMEHLLSDLAATVQAIRQ